jgi:5'-phosphate synthase pdxT subunit
MVGVLALHGDFLEHTELLRSMRVPCREVRILGDLRRCDRLIIPGGESTVMAKLLKETGLDREIQRRVGEGSLAVYGTCAGAILLARKATGKNAPPTLGLIDITVERNAYGTQFQSFEATIRLKGQRSPLTVAFIRSPKILKVGKGIEILATHGKDPILVRQGRILAGTFHPEVRGEREIHRIFLRM